MKPHSLANRRFVSLFICLSVIVAGSLALAAESSIDSTDKSFIQGAYKDGLAEVKMAEMAKEKSSNADVKAFAEEMITDHGKADSELKKLAHSKNVELADSAGLIDQGKAKLLEMKSGADFDKAYADSMVNAHKDAVETFTKAVNEAKDADVKAFATKTLPTLKGHLSKAEALQKKVGK